MDRFLADKLCSSFMKNKDKKSYEKIIQYSKLFSNSIKNKLSLILPTSKRPKTTPFSGRGFIDVEKTMINFISRGRKVENIMEKARGDAKKNLKVVILFDDSNSTTSWWRKENLKQIGPSISSFQKILAISFCEAFKSFSDVDIMIYSDDAFFISKKNYVDLLLRNGSGSTRLDIALNKLYEEKWMKKGGEPLVIILSDGVCEAGKGNINQDLMIQKQTLKTISRLVEDKVKILYVLLSFDNDKFLKKKVGDYFPLEFLKECKKHGCFIKHILGFDRISTNILKSLENIYK